jgi:hypothetical protein
VVYPECALTAPPPTEQMPLSSCVQDSKPFWGSACSSQPGGDPILGCVGVPRFRQLLISNPPEKVGLNQLKRMMGQNTFQRSGLTVNNGVYYVDTTVSKTKQEGARAKSPIFTANQKFDLFFLYANKNTAQTYQLFVGKNIPDTSNGDFAKTNVKFGYVDITTNHYKFLAGYAQGQEAG